MKTATIQGIRIPRVGLGTWQLQGTECYRAVRTALELGYRHIDTAAAYENEEVVGRAIAEAHVDREDVFLVTKIWSSELSSGKLGQSLKDSLRRLDTDYVDLALVHWPNPDIPLSETLQALILARDQGLCHHVGVSNFTVDLMRRTLAEITPLALQVEYHPLLDQSELLRICREHDMMLAAYSPLAQGQVLEEPVLKQIAARHDATPAQVALAWLLRDPHVVVIPRSRSGSHMEANLQATELELTDDDISRIDNLPKDHRIIDPPFAPEWDRPLIGA